MMTNHRKQRYWFILLFLMVFVGLRYSYGILRLNVSLSDFDTMQMTRAINSAIETESIINTSSAYDHGYAYQAIVIFVMRMTGLSLQQMQFFAMPLMEVGVVFIVFVTYRKLLQNDSVAFIATLFLYIQPDFFWVIWRGAHERIGWPIIFALLFLLMSGFEHRNQLSYFIRYTLLYYLCSFSLSSTNTFYALSFMAALMLSIIAGYVFVAFSNLFNHKLTAASVTVFRRLIYVLIASIIIEYLVLIYVYPEAQSSLIAMQTVLQKFALFVSGTDPMTNPYAYVSLSWLSARLYIALNFFTWLILIIGFLKWAGDTIKMLRKNTLTDDDSHSIFLLALYVGFSAQLVVAVLLDLSGAYGGNLQLRVFTGVILISIPFMAQVTWSLVKRLMTIPNHYKYALALLIIAPIIMLVNITTLLKASNEPFLNQRWLFTTTQETQAVEWIVDNAGTVTPFVWIGLDERIIAHLRTVNPTWSQRDILFQTANRDRFEQDITYYVLSEIERYRWQRRNLDLPYLGNHHIIYSNRNTNVYHRRATTPYQN